MVTLSKQWTKCSQIFPSLKRKENFMGGRAGDLGSALSGQAWAEGCLRPAPLSKGSDSHSSSPAPPPLQMQRLRAGYMKEMGCHVVVRLEGDPNEQKDTNLPSIPPPAFAPSLILKGKCLKPKSLLKKAQNRATKA